MKNTKNKKVIRESNEMMFKFKEMNEMGSRIKKLKWHHLHADRSLLCYIVLLLYAYFACLVV